MITNKTYLILIAFIFLTAQNNYSQSNKKPIDYRFEENELGLRQFIQNNIIFPESSIIKGTVGFSISCISVTPEGKIDQIYILNPIDKAIDSEMIRVLKLSKNRWKASDTIISNQAFYIQVAFILGEANVVYPAIKNPFFIDPLIITAYSNTQTRPPVTDEILTKKSSDLIGAEKFKQALPYINDLIKRYPFNKDLYQYRISIYKKINRNELIESDIQKISNFIPGVSLDDLLKN
jgi:hypothetical protein